MQQFYTDDEGYFYYLPGLYRQSLKIYLVISLDGGKIFGTFIKMMIARLKINT